MNISLGRHVSSVSNSCKQTNFFYLVQLVLVATVFRHNWTSYGSCSAFFHLLLHYSECFYLVNNYFIGAKMSADKVEYALMYSNLKIETVESFELVAKFPEAVVAFLERQIHFSWPQTVAPFDSNNTLCNRLAFITACTNQGGNGIKYLLSNRDNQFLRIMPSHIAVEFAPHVVTKYLESNLDLQDCDPLPGKQFMCEFFHLFYYC